MGWKIQVQEKDRASAKAAVVAALAGQTMDAARRTQIATAAASLIDAFGAIGSAVDRVPIGVVSTGEFVPNGAGSASITVTSGPLPKVQP